MPLRPAALLKRSLIFVHRWLGVALSLLFLLWFVSGIVMMYWGFPNVGTLDRLQRAPTLAPEPVAVSAETAFAALNRDTAPAQVRLTSFDGRPVYRFAAGGARGRGGPGPGRGAEGGLPRDALAEHPEGPERLGVAVEAKRSPDVPVPREAEAFRHHTDDLRGSAAQTNDAPEDPGIGLEPGAPQLVADETTAGAPGAASEAVNGRPSVGCTDSRANVDVAIAAVETGSVARPSMARFIVRRADIPSPSKNL